ncbi:MAG: DNA methyltransferase [Candidatus Poribacteria bacterium]|nr:DNA methyltransferase [Candidatus Poribacteria bacterium]
MNSASVDLIYLDPPFNSNANYAAPIGSEAAGAEFKDTWTLNDVDVAWLDLIEAKHPALNRVIHAAMTDSDKSYLIYMAVRLLEMHRILKPTGSIYLHCDPTMSHYLKLVMDAVFGKGNFMNEVVWKRTAAHNDSAVYGGIHDTILYYSKGDSATLNEQYQPYSDEYLKRYRHTDENGKRFLDRDLTAGSLSGGGYQYQWNGITKIWRCPFTTMQEYHKSGKLYYTRNGTPRLKQFLDDMPGVPVQDVWIDIPPINSQAKERVGYPTQKPLALLDRIIKASSNEGHVVFDPFCGCATTLVAADRLQRDWIGIDISAKATELVVERINTDQGMFEDIVARTDIPKRTDIGDIPRYNAPENKTLLYGEQAGNCNGCGDHFQTQHLEIDHIIAKSVGGTDHIENLQLLCGHCNRIKGNRGQEYLLSRLNKD